jgi:hypothetical protein
MQGDMSGEKMLSSKVSCVPASATNVVSCSLGKQIKDRRPMQIYHSIPHP